MYIWERGTIDGYYKQINVKIEKMDYNKISFDSLLDKIYHYCDTIHEPFIYTIRGNPYLLLFRLFLGLPIIFLFYSSIVGFIPAGLRNKIPEIYGEFFNFGQIIIRTDNLFFWWIICVVILFPLFRIFNKIDKNWKNSIDRKSLSKNQLTVCYLQKSIVSLEKFLVSGFQSNLDNAKNYLNDYLKIANFKIPSAILSKNLKIESKGSANIHDLIFTIKKNYSWVKFDENAIVVAVALKDFDNKIIRRINQGVEIKEIILPLKKLLAYEYLINIGLYDGGLKNDEVVNQYAQDQLIGFGEEISQIYIIEKETVQYKEKSYNVFRNKIKSSFYRLSTHQSLVVRFFVWWLLIFAIAFLSIIIAILILPQITLDSTILIGLISIPIASAIGIMTLHSNQKKD